MLKVENLIFKNRDISNPDDVYYNDGKDTLKSLTLHNPLDHEIEYRSDSTYAISGIYKIHLDKKSGVLHCNKPGCSTGVNSCLWIRECWYEAKITLESKKGGLIEEQQIKRGVKKVIAVVPFGAFLIINDQTLFITNKKLISTQKGLQPYERRTISNEHLSISNRVGHSISVTPTSPCYNMVMGKHSLNQIHNT